MIGRPLPTLPTLRTRSPLSAVARPELKKQGVKPWEPTPPDVDTLERIAADPPGTLPERLVKAWLDDRHIPYTSQHVEGGGDLRLGGAVIDFLLPTLGIPPGTIIRVQGDYWHSMKERKDKDWMQYQTLVRKGYRVIDAWEGDLRDAALQGNLYTYLDNLVYDSAA